MESRWRWEGDRIPRGLLRLSVGLEDVEAIWADLAALDRAAEPSRCCETGQTRSNRQSRRMGLEPTAWLYKSAALPTELLRRALV